MLHIHVAMVTVVPAGGDYNSINYSVTFLQGRSYYQC